MQGDARPFSPQNASSQQISGLLPLAFTADHTSSEALVHRNPPVLNMLCQVFLDTQQRISLYSSHLKATSYHLDLLEVPGHSSCSIAAYVPEEKVLFASDAAGVYYKNFVFAAGNSNYDRYQKSLHRMATYPVEVVLLKHYGAAVGEEARTLFAKALQTAEDTRSAIENSYRLTGDVTKTTEAITRFVLARSPDYFLDKEILSMVIGQMVKFIIKTQEEKERSWRSS